jgi:hypothetical protein
MLPVGCASVNDSQDVVKRKFMSAVASTGISIWSFLTLSWRGWLGCKPQLGIASSNVEPKEFWFRDWVLGLRV